MDKRTKVAAAWWAQAVREKQNGAGAAQDALSEHQIEEFEAALAREIDAILPRDLTHVLAVNHKSADEPFNAAAATCGIENIAGKLPAATIMRIFPDTVMAHHGPRAGVEILWSSNERLNGGGPGAAS